MSNYDYDLGILGGGAAGLTAAAGAAQFGAKTLLIEKHDKLGGDCLHFGCVPSKTLIRSAGVWDLAGRAEEFGLPPVERKKVDLARVMERVKTVVDNIQEHDSVERFCKLGAEVRFGSPTFVNDHSVEVNGDVVTARNWIIATGSSPAAPPIKGLDTVDYWTNENVFSQKELPDRLLVLGGGPIGLELAQSFQRLGSKVTVVEFMDRILSVEDPVVSEIIAGKLASEGIELLTSTKAVEASTCSEKVSLVVERLGDNATVTLTADALLVATGRKPNVAGLGLENAGVEHAPRGIPVDERLRTNVKHIYACGDVNGTLPFTHVAGYEGGVALTNIVLHLPRKADYSKVPWTTYTDPEVASVGFNETRATQAGIDYKLIEEEFSSNDRALAEGETTGRLRLLLDKKAKVIGCQIVGPHGGELIHEWVAAINGGVKLSTMAGAIHAYPTLSEISKRAAGNHFSEKLFSDKTRGILKLLFRFKGRACEPAGNEEP